MSNQRSISRLDVIADIKRANQSNNGTAHSVEVPGNVKPLRIQRMSNVMAEEVDWLWNPFIAMGTFTLASGEEGIGKTFLTLSIANAVASGFPLPFDPQKREPANVLFLSAEDSLKFTLKPRLDAMEANCDRIYACNEAFTLDQDGFLLLKAAIAETEAKLVVIDPLFSYVGPKDINRDNEIRVIGNKIIEIAEKFDCAILGVRHIGKSKGFGDARNAGLGGIGWRACCRSELLVGSDPNNPKDRALVQTKNNLGQKSETSVGFDIQEGQFLWNRNSKLTAGQILSSLKSEDEKYTANDAVDFLREVLRNGKMESRAVIKEARARGVTDYAFRQAKSSLKVETFKEGFDGGTWYLKLPDLGAAEDVEF